jgi:hypothetical protein
MNSKMIVIILVKINSHSKNMKQRQIPLRFAPPPFSKWGSGNAVHLTVRGELVEPPATHPEPFESQGERNFY